MSNSQRTSQPAAQRIDLHIEDLVLHGVSPADGRALAGAIEREIARALNGRTVDLAGDRRIDQVATRDVTLNGTGGPARIAAEVARSVTGAMGVTPARSTTTVHLPATKR